MNKLLIALTMSSVFASTVQARDLSAIDITSLGGEPLNAEQISLFEGSWVEVQILGEIEPKHESTRKQECTYLFGQNLFDHEPSEDLSAMSVFAPGLESAKGQLFITQDSRGPLLATEGAWSTTIKSGDVHRIAPTANGWFDVAFYSARRLQKKDGKWAWQQVSTLEDGQVFLNGLYRIRLIQLPSGAVTPIMQNITYGLPTDMHERSQYLLRCENIPQQPQG
ncbi:MAG: hypothetical protein EP340_00530 [Alphaproteobacteria bacterium]|nr:MAG: hypothetical protein EP340_00530 [Alphaproteobacteria bacterium]